MQALCCHQSKGSDHEKEWSQVSCSRYKRKFCGHNWLDPFDITSSGIPLINKRIYTGSGTFKFAGTAQNSENGYSTVLTLNLTNNPGIPTGAIIKSANTTGTMSTNVGGVQHMLGSGSAGWLASSATNGRASFDFHHIM